MASQLHRLPTYTACVLQCNGIAIHTVALLRTERWLEEHEAALRGAETSRSLHHRRVLADAFERELQVHDALQNAGGEQS